MLWLIDIVYNQYHPHFIKKVSASTEILHLQMPYGIVSRHVTAMIPQRNFVCHFVFFLSFQILLKGFRKKKKKNITKMKNENFSSLLLLLPSSFHSMTFGYYYYYYSMVLNYWFDNWVFNFRYTVFMDKGFMHMS